MELGRSLLEREQSSPVGVRRREEGAMKPGGSDAVKCRVNGCSSVSMTRRLWPTVVPLITDADHPARAVAVAAAEPRAGLADVHVVHPPALPLAGALLLDPAELGGPERNGTKELRTSASSPAVRTSRYNHRHFLFPYPDETWSGSWIVTLVHVELLTGL